MASNEAMVRAIVSLIETVQVVSPHHAKLAKTYYDAYVAAGFTEDQAFELTKMALASTSATV